MKAGEATVIEMFGIETRLRGTQISASICVESKNSMGAFVARRTANS